MAKEDWSYLTQAEAKQRKLYGFGGSVLVVYLLAAFLTVWQLYGAANTIDGLDLMYEGPENAFIMQHVLMFKAMTWIPFLILAPIRHPLMPRVTLICIVTAFLADFVAINFVIGLPMPKSMGVNIFNLLTAAAFGWYFLSSKRVDLTYRLRERPAVTPPN